MAALSSVSTCCSSWTAIHWPRKVRSTLRNAGGQGQGLAAVRHTQNRNMFVFGIGHVGLALAQCLQKQGWDVSGTCSSDEKGQALQKNGLRAFHFNSDNDGEELGPEGMWAMSNASHLIVTIPPVADFDKDPVLSMYREELIRMASCMNLNWIGYLSSTGVYGNYQGEWVDENSLPKPTNNQAVARLEAEKAWLQLGLDCHVCVQIFRLGGIYGPGRSAINTLLRSDEVSPKQRARQRRLFTSRIHVADICRAVLASIESPRAGRIYNVVDDEPAPRSEVFSYAKALILQKWPSKATALMERVDAVTSGDMTEPLHFLEKRVMNRRLKEELGVDLLYPTYKEGLNSIIEHLDV